MLSRKHEVLCQVTKPLNDLVLFEETEMPFRAFRLWKTKIFQCLFHVCACEYLQHLELDKSFFISTGIAYIRFCHSFWKSFTSAFVHCVRYAQDNIIMLILNKLLELGSKSLTRRGRFLELLLRT